MKNERAHNLVLKVLQIEVVQTQPVLNVKNLHLKVVLHWGFPEDLCNEGHWIDKKGDEKRKSQKATDYRWVERAPFEKEALMILTEGDIFNNVSDFL